MISKQFSSVSERAREWEKECSDFRNSTKNWLKIQAICYFRKWQIPVLFYCKTESNNIVRKECFLLCLLLNWVLSLLCWLQGLIYVRIADLMEVNKHIVTSWVVSSILWTSGFSNIMWTSEIVSSASERALQQEKTRRVN